jgi:hypothetical protein
MQLPILPAGAQSIADDPPALRTLCICFGVLLAILPLAHALGRAGARLKLAPGTRRRATKSRAGPGLL